MADGDSAAMVGSGWRESPSGVDARKVTEILGACPPVRLPERDYSGPLGALDLLEQVRRLRDRGDEPGPS